MNAAVQITLIVCATIIAMTLINKLVGGKDK